MAQNLGGISGEALHKKTLRHIDVLPAAINFYRWICEWETILSAKQ